MKLVPLRFLNSSGISYWGRNKCHYSDWRREDSRRPYQCVLKTDDCKRPNQTLLTDNH